MAGGKITAPVTKLLDSGEHGLREPSSTRQPTGPERKPSTSGSGILGLPRRAPMPSRSASMSSATTAVSASSSGQTSSTTNLARTNSDLSTASTAASYTKDGTFSIPRKPVPESPGTKGRDALDLAGIEPKKQIKDMPHSTPLAGDLETRPSSRKNPDGDDVDDTIAKMTKSADDNMRLQMASQTIQSRQAAISSLNELNKSLIDARKNAAKDVSEAGEKPS